MGKCSPLLTVGKNDKVSFVFEIQVKEHLRRQSSALLGFTEEETEWHHGVLAWRCFLYLSDRFQGEETPNNTGETGDNAGNDLTAAETPAKSLPDASDEVEVDGEGDGEGGNQSNASDSNDGDSDDDDGSASDEGDSSLGNDAVSETDPSDASSDDGLEPRVQDALRYPVKHWLTHASQATTELAEKISQEAVFWAPDSVVRRRWLQAHEEYDGSANGLLNTPGSTALHAAAAIGYASLVAALIDNGHENEINAQDEITNAPVSQVVDSW